MSASEFRATSQEVSRLAEYIKSNFFVDCERGLVFRREDLALAGNVVQGGYRRVYVSGRPMNCSRVVYFCATGEMPPQVDHIDGDPSNDSIANLRACTHAQNMRNKKRYKVNKSGVSGVHFDTNSKRWVAGVCVKGVKRRKTFKEFEDAVAYRQLMADEAYGTFQRKSSGGYNTN